MEACAHCGKEIKAKTLVAWRGSLYCNKECVYNHIKQQGIDKYLIHGIVETESEVLARSDINV